MERIINNDVLTKYQPPYINKVCAVAESELKPMTAKEYDLLGDKVIIARTSDCLWVFAKSETK